LTRITLNNASFGFDNHSTPFPDDTSNYVGDYPGEQGDYTEERLRGQCPIQYHGDGQSQDHMAGHTEKHEYRRVPEGPPKKRVFQQIGIVGKGVKGTACFLRFDAV
jgi:hypothetical protein